MGVETKIEAAEKVDDASAKDAIGQVAAWLNNPAEKKTKFVPFEKPFRPNIPATWAAALSASNEVEREVRWIIEGWLIDDVVPHYGPPKVGKSTGIAGIIACIASIDTASGKRAKTWCDHWINHHGKVVYYTGEETVGDVKARMRRAFKKMGYKGDDLKAVMDRILIISPKSMKKEQYAGLNPFICAKMPIGNLRHEEYQATAMLDWIYDVIDDHNAELRATGGDESDLIIGVVFDSTTSVAGFSSTDEEGISNLLFELARSGQDRGVFTILVAHSPESAKYWPDKPDFKAIHRLKGNGAWTAICRLFIEWRPPAEKAKSGWYEAKGLFDQEIVSDNDELVVCVVGDGNGDFSQQKMWFKRDGEGGHVDLSRFMKHEPRGFTADKWQAIQDRAAAEKAAAGVAAPSAAKVDREPAADLIIKLVNDVMKANATEAREQSKKVPGAATAKAILALFKSWKADPAARKAYPVLAREPSAGGISAHTGRDYSVSWWIEKLIADGRLADVVGGVVLPDRVGEGYRLRNAPTEQAEAVIPEPTPVDFDSVSEAVLAVVSAMEKEFDAADGEAAHEVPVNAKNIELALRSSRFQDPAQGGHTVLRDAYTDGRLVRNGMASKPAIVHSGEWYCEELFKANRLLRLRDGTYALPVEDERKAA